MSSYRVIQLKLVFLEMSPKKLTLLVFTFLSGLILYDTLQQKYYVEAFNISSGLDQTLIDLLKRHLSRWMIWLIVSAPFGGLAWKWIKAQPRHINTLTILKLFFLSVGAIFFSLVTITLSTLIIANGNLVGFYEYFTFYFFQKGLLFFMADSVVIILLYNYAKEQLIQSQYVAIEELKEAEHHGMVKIPQMMIKTGHRISSVSLKDIIWIQSDDYCSKIHTGNDQSFTLRKSLKSLEKELAPFGFVRIHRSALLNLSFVNQLNLEKSMVQLQNNIELPVSRSRVKLLKESLSQFSV